MGGVGGFDMKTDREWSEKQLTDKIIRMLNGYRETTWVYKRHAVSNEAGKPDITGIHEGLRVEMEVKSPSRNLGSISANIEIASKIQRHHIKRIQRLGGIAGVVCTLDQAAELVFGKST